MSKIKLGMLAVAIAILLWTISPARAYTPDEIDRPDLQIRWQVIDIQVPMGKHKIFCAAQVGSNDLECVKIF